MNPRMDDRTIGGAPVPRRGPVRVAALLAAAAVTAALAGPAFPGRDAGGLGVSPERARGVLAQHPMRTLDGRALSFGELRGQVVVVNFWASWCAPCRKELPRLEALHRELAARGGRVLAISIDREERNARRFARQHGLELPIVHDGPDGLARTLDLPHVPFTLVLDRSGAVAFTTGGSDDAALVALGSATRRLLDAQPPVSHTTEGGNP